MTFWQENYSFIKEIYDMRHTKMAEWMENVEKSISRIMADRVYTSAEFKRERDNFHVSFQKSIMEYKIILSWFFKALCKDLERADIKKWLQQILEILMADRNSDMKNKEYKKLEDLVKKHEDLIPSVQKTSVMVDLY